MKYTTDKVVSKDGTEIGFRQAGKGPGVILIHGGMMASQNFTQLGECLADDFTVFIPDRRGRGMSGGSKAPGGLAPEGEDIQALVRKTGARCIFGLSSGAIVSLQAALSEPAVTKVAIYEPPLLFTDGPLAWVSGYEKAIQQDNYGAAMAAVLKGTGDKGIFSLLPKFVLAPLFNFAIRGEDKKREENKVPVKDLVKAMYRDIQIVRESTAVIDRYKNLTADLLLLGGSKSIDYLRKNLDIMAAAMPQAKRIEFIGEGHVLASDNSRPEKVAVELKRFFRE